MVFFDKSPLLKEKTQLFLEFCWFNIPELVNDKFRILIKHVTHPKNYTVSMLNATEISDNAACYVPLFAQVNSGCLL